MLENMTSTTTSTISVGTNGVYLILIIVAKWLILEKMGEKGWKALIPFYSEYLIVRNTWTGAAYWAQLITGAIGAIAFTISAILVVFNGRAHVSITLIFLLIGVAFLIINLIINIKAFHRLAMAFGHGAGFTVGLVLLHPLFMLILGLEKNEYMGRQS